MTQSQTNTHTNKTKKQKTLCTGCFKSLGVSARMDIYQYLSQNEQATVNQLVDQVSLTQPTVSYHLSEMKKNGLLLSEKSGKEVIYKLKMECSHYGTPCVLKSVNLPMKEA